MNVEKVKKYSPKRMKEYCQTEEIEKLHNLKLYLDDLYYNTDKSDFPDSLYDILKDILIKRDPTYVPPVGAKIRTNQNRVKIPFHMGSADKITPSDEKELVRWFEKNSCDELIVSDKLDGVSGTYIYKNGKQKLYTRGNGDIGADISFLIQYISTIPKIKGMKDNIAVRGELIIKKKIFEEKYKFNGNGVEYKTEKKEIKGVGRTYKHSRNMVSGLVGAKTVRQGLDDLQFIVYEIIGDETMPKPENQMKELKKLGFTPVNWKVIQKTKKIEKWIQIHDEFKKNSEYEIDGIVVQSNVKYDRNTSGNPDYLFAFKVNAEENIVETTVLDIEWSVSKWGQIIPVAIIDPVELPGVTISRVTVSNASLMYEKMIGPGSIINVTRSNEVIPFIDSVVEPCEELKYPNMEYEWDDNNVHLIVVNPIPELIDNMRIKLFASFFDKMSIKHVSVQTVSKLYKGGLNTLLKIVKATKKDLMKIFKEKSATRIFDNIRVGLKGVKASQLLGAAGVFGYGIGRKRMDALLTDIPDILSTNKKGLKKRILEVEGFSDIMADKIVANIDYAVGFIDELSDYVSFADDTRVSDELVGKKFVFSGFRSKELEQHIVDRGGSIATSVSKKTSGLIVNVKEGVLTGKSAKAQSCGVSIYTKEEFIKKYIV